MAINPHVPRGSLGTVPTLRPAPAPVVHIQRCPHCNARSLVKDADGILCILCAWRPVDLSPRRVVEAQP